MPIFKFYRKHGMKRASIGITVLLVVIAAGAAAYFLVPGIRLSEPESTARYFPDDVLAYSWATVNPGVTLNPDPGQWKHMLDIWERFNEIPEFQDRVDELLDAFEDGTGIDFKEEVIPWIGPDISLAVLDARGFETVDAAAMLGVRDQDAASAFLEDWLEYMEEEKETRFEKDSSGGFDIWADEGKGQFYALSGDWLVLANTEDALDEVLDRISEDGRKSLAENPDFEQARAAMSDLRIMSVYVDLEAVMDTLSDMSGVELTPRTPTAGILTTPDWLAISARFEHRSVVVDMTAPNGSEFETGFPGIGKPASLLPGDTLALIAASFDPDLDNWRAELGKYTLADLGFPDDAGHMLNELEAASSESGIQRDLGRDSTAAEILDMLVSGINILTGIHPEKDLLNHLAGQVIISVRDFNFDRVEDFEEHAVDATAMFSYIPDSEVDLMNTMHKITDIIESSGFVTSDRKDIGADKDVVVFDPGGMMREMAYSPGYVINGGYLTMGSTNDAIESIVDVQNGNAVALADAPAYRRARAHLPDSLQFLAFLDLQRIIVQLNPDDMGMGQDDYKILEEGFSAIAVGANTNASHSRSVFVLTLFPE